MALCSQGINLLLVIGGSRARAVASHRFGERRWPAVSPHFMAALRVIGDKHFLLSPLFDGVSQTAGNREGAITAAARLAPKQPQAICPPVGQDRPFIVMAIAIGPSEGSPIGTGRGRV